MKKLLSLILSVSLVVSLFSGCTRVNEFTFCPSEESGDIGVVTFNVAAPWGNILKGTGKNVRVKRFAAYMNAVKPDIIGTQEMSSDWMEKLSTLMPDYDSYGIKRGGDEKESNSELNSLFWLKDKYECIESNTFWLSKTPETESRYEGAGCNRICSYVMLRDIENGRYILALNTHLDNASDEARVFGAQLIYDKIKEIAENNDVSDYSTVITGDFNDYLEGAPSKLSELKLNNSVVEGNTYHEWGEITEGSPIDFIFTDEAIKWSTRLDDTSNGYVSDHYGVYSAIDFE